MKRGILIVAVFVASAVGAILSGCSAERPAAEPAAPAMSAETATQSEASEALAKLSPEDRAQAQAQKICPVSDEPLGSMGEPIKVTVDGKSLFVCCESCVDELKANFAEYADEVGN